MADHLFVEYQGAVALVHAALYTPSAHNLRLLSIGGPTEAVRSVLLGAQDTERPLVFFVKKERLSLAESGRELKERTRHDGTPIRLLIKKLPCGQAHGILHPDLDPIESPAHFALVLPVEQRTAAPARLLDLLDARTTFPLHASWSTWVWTRFLYHKFLTPLAGQGTWAGWEVRWDEALLRQEIREALAGHTLQVA
jgi:hypothetical protein